MSNIILHIAFGSVSIYGFLLLWYTQTRGFIAVTDAMRKKDIERVVSGVWRTYIFCSCVLIILIGIRILFKI